MSSLDTRAIVIAVAMFVALTVFDGELRAQEYSAWTAPQVGPILHNTVVSAPDGETPDTRTDIGQGELAECWFDETSWQDRDCNLSNNSIVDDLMGDYSWSLSGSQASYSSLDSSLEFSSTHGNGVVLISSPYAGSVSVILSVEDSGAHGAIHEVAEATQEFALKSPTGATYAKSAWMNIFNPVIPPQENKLGAAQGFLVTLQPLSMDYQRMNFREWFGDATEDIFPDGNTKWTSPQGAKSA